MSLSFRQRMTHRLMRWMARFMPPCRDVALLVSRGMDEPLPWSRRLLIRLHVGMCSLCRRYERQVRLVRHGVRQGADPDTAPLPETLSPEARERLRRALETGS